MKPRAFSVGVVLEHWVAEFAKFGHAKLSTTSSQSLAIEFMLPTLDQAFASHEDVAALREALEILHLAALLDLPSVEDAVAGLCYHSFTEPDPEDEDALDAGRKPAPASTEPLAPFDPSREVEFVLTFYGTPGRFLEETVAPALFEVHGPRSEAYLSARKELLQGNAVPNRPINCRVNIVSMDGGFDDEVEEDYIQRVMSFVRLLDESAVKIDANQLEVGEYLPVHINSIHLELNEIPITKENVEAVSVLTTSSIPVVCNRVGINPCALTCASDELSVFIETLGARSLEMSVEIGHVNMSEPTNGINTDGSSQEELIRTLFRAIFGARCVTSVSFGPLLAMTSTPANRKTLWHELFACLTDERTVAPVSSLILSPQIELLDDDAVLIQDAVSRAASPTQINSLMLWLNESSPEAVQALVRAVGGNLTTVTLHSELHTMTPSQTVNTIVRECPLLQELSLTSAEVETMTIFSHQNVQLRELSFNSVVVQDASSLTDFFSNLSDPKTPLAKTLRKFHVKTENNAADHLALDTSHAALVEQVLETNKVINDLEFSISDDIPTTTLMAIQSYDREVLAEPLTLTQKLAFLSATQPRVSEASNSPSNHVDGDVGRLIFAFAAERVARHVYLDF